MLQNKHVTRIKVQFYMNTQWHTQYTSMRA